MSKLENRHNNVIAIFAVGSLALGTASTLAGAVATIYTADLGFQLANLTRRSDVIKSFEERLIKSENLYADILDKLNQVYTSEEFFEAGISANHSDSMSDENPNLIARLGNIKERLISLSAALKAAARDDLTSSCFKKHWQISSSRVNAINEELRQNGKLQRVVDIVILNDLVDVANLFEKAGNDAAGELGDFIIISDSKNPNVTKDLKGPRLSRSSEMEAFIKLGNIVSKNYISGDHSRILYGAAIVRDLVFNTPKGSDIVNCYHDKYDDIRYNDLETNAEIMKISSFDPNSVVGERLVSTINVFDSSQEHYFEAQ